MRKGDRLEEYVNLLDFFFSSKLNSQRELCIYIFSYTINEKCLCVQPKHPGCMPCKVYAEDTPILTIDSIVICQTHAEDLRRRLLKMHPG